MENPVSEELYDIGIDVFEQAIKKFSCDSNDVMKCETFVTKDKIHDVLEKIISIEDYYIKYPYIEEWIVMYNNSMYCEALDSKIGKEQLEKKLITIPTILKERRNEYYNALSK